MAVFDYSARKQSGFVPGLAMRVVRLRGAVLRAWNNRRQFNRLRDMSDRELADIGLTRDDLHHAWRSRLDQDPLRYLGAVARSRSTAEDAARRVS